MHVVPQVDLQAVFLLNTRPCIDFSPYLDTRLSIRPTLRKGPYGLKAFRPKGPYGLIFVKSRLRSRGGGYKGGVLHKGFKGEEKRGGEKGGGVGEGDHALQVVVFDGFVNKTKKFSKKVSRFFGF